MATEGREFGWEDTIKEDAQEFEPLLEGDYNVTIEKFDRSRSSGSGKLPACNMAATIREMRFMFIRDRRS